MDFEEHEEQEEEMEMSGVPSSGYDTWSGGGARRTGGGAAAVRYRDCRKNHAVSIGGYAVDGCGEFMPADEDGKLDAHKCAACGCHRNFHFKETDATTASATAFHHQGAPSPYYRPPPPPSGYLHLTAPPSLAHLHRPLALPPAAAVEEAEEDASNPSSSCGGGGGVSGMMKKRFRTKFTTEQKEKMLGFAEQLGWRIQKHDEAAVEQFCAETGVKRHVLKVWMHNNKNTLGKKP